MLDAFGESSGMTRNPIPPEEIAKLTQPFYSRKPGGTGLGLAIVDRIIAAHRRQLTISSSGEEGTTVLVTLPWTSPPVDC